MVRIKWSVVLAVCALIGGFVPVAQAQGLQINFWADRAIVTVGECTVLHWDVDGAREIYLDGQGVTGHETRQVCPSGSIEFVLRVVTDQSNDERRVLLLVRPATPDPVATQAGLSADTVNRLWGRLDDGVYATFIEKVKKVRRPEKCALDLIKGLENPMPVSFGFYIPNYPLEVAEDCFDEDGGMMNLLNNLMAAP